MIDVAQEAPETVILAEDEASLYLQATTTVVWAPVGQPPEIRVAANRDKVSFYGSLILQSGQEIVTREETMNAEASARHLLTILQTIPDKPILLLWDRAPWHRGQPIRDVLAANPRLEIIYFPTGAPELNPQEHVWKATRRAVSHNHDQMSFSNLADRFEDHLNDNSFHSSFLDRYNFATLCSMFESMTFK